MKLFKLFIIILLSMAMKTQCDYYESNPRYDSEVRTGPTGSRLIFSEASRQKIRRDSKPSRMILSSTEEDEF